MEDLEFVDMKTAMSVLGLCKKTLQNYEKQGKIETIRTSGNWRRFNIKKYLEKNNIKIEPKKLIKKKIIYCRVSSYDRKEDLSRQIDYLKEKYPNHEVISDIGSGINFKRKGLNQLIELAIENKLEEVVVTYKDRLCRIGYELIENILTKYSKTKIIIDKIEEDTKGTEITRDLIEIITVYSSKLHGRRTNKIN